MVFLPLPRFCALEGFGLWGFIMLKAVDVCRPCNWMSWACNTFVPTRTPEWSSRCPFIPDLCIPTVMVPFTIGTTGL